MSLSIESYKVLAEICVSDDPETFDLLNSISIPRMEEVVINAGSANTKLSSLNLILEFLRVSGKSQAYVENVRRSVSKRSMTFNPRLIAYLYTQLDPIKEELKLYLLHKFSEHTKVDKQSLYPFLDDLWTDFSEFIRAKAQMRYDPSTDIIPFLKHVINNYYRVTGPEFSQKFRSRGVHQTNQATNTDLTFLMRESNLDQDLEGFSEIAYNIVRFSDLFYTHSNVIYYDLVSREKLKLVTSVVDKCNAFVNSTFRDLPSFRFSVEDVNLKVVKDDPSIEIDLNFENPNSTIGKKFAHREDLMSILEKALYTDLSKSDWIGFIKKAVDVDGSKSLKDKVPVFNTQGLHGESKIRMSFEDMIEVIILGIGSLRKLLNHVESSDRFKLLRIPSDIFKNKKLTNQFSTLNRYIRVIHITRKLRSENAMEASKNDQLVSSLLAGETKTLDISMSSIRKVIGSQFHIANRKRVEQEVPPLLNRESILLPSRIFNDFLDQKRDFSQDEETFRNQILVFAASCLFGQHSLHILGRGDLSKRAYVQLDSSLYQKTDPTFNIGDTLNQGTEKLSVDALMKLIPPNKELDPALSLFRRVNLFFSILNLTLLIQKTLHFSLDEYRNARRESFRPGISNSDRELIWEKFFFPIMASVEFKKDFRPALPEDFSGNVLIPSEMTKPAGLVHAVSSHKRINFPLKTADISEIRDLLGPRGLFIAGEHEDYDLVCEDYLLCYNNVIRIFKSFVQEYNRMWEIVDNFYKGALIETAEMDLELLFEIITNFTIIQLNRHPNFEEFLQSSGFTEDITTGLFKDVMGNYVTRIIEGNKAYLHRQGVWVIPNRSVRQYVYPWRP